MIRDKSVIDKFLSPYKVVALTGAGVSAASGVPTFRGKEGLWKKYSPQELANPDSFVAQPQLVWEWYLWRRKLISEVKPNSAHHALVDLEKINSNFTLITQNVDNLHQEAGSTGVIELHGNIMKNKCFNCSQPSTVDIHIEQGLPHCTDCGGLIRPDVVWFGESLPLQAFQDAQIAATECDLFLSIGTSGVVEPAASLPFIAKSHNTYVIEINKERTPLTDQADLFLQNTVDIVLPEILKKIDQAINN
jgi:NAD-dependent deacetylase